MNAIKNKQLVLRNRGMRGACVVHIKIFGLLRDVPAAFAKPVVPGSVLKLTENIIW